MGSTSPESHSNTRDGPFCRRQIEAVSPLNRWRSRGFSLEVPVHPESYLREFLGQVTVGPAKPSSAPGRVELLYKGPWYEDLLGSDWGGTGLLVVASVFPANTACAKASYPTGAVGLPRSLAWLPTPHDPGVGQLRARGQEISGRRSAPRRVPCSPSQAWPGPGGRERSKSGPRNMTLSGGAGGSLRPSPGTG